VTPATGEKLLPDTARDLLRRELESLRQASIRQLAENAAPGSLLAALHDRQWPGTTPRHFTDAALHLAGAARDLGCEATRQLCQELIVSLSFYETALEAFGPASLGPLVTCLKDRNYAVIDDLAVARYAMRVNAALGHQLLEQYRLRHRMETRHDIG
jgi:hypothetical protein